MIKKKSGRHKNRVRRNAATYSDMFGTQGTSNGNDVLDGDNFSEQQTPWAREACSDAEYEQVDKLFDLYHQLKGRRKQVLGLLLRGEDNQTMIAKELNMKQSNVNRVIKSIKEIFLKHHIV